MARPIWFRCVGAGSNAVDELIYLEHAGPYGGGGAQSLSLGASATAQVTDATSLNQLSGPFAYFLVGVGDVYGGTVIVFIGQASIQ